MALLETRYEHIAIGEDGVPVIFGTTVKVVEVVLDKLAHGWSPEEIHLQHPHLSLGQIHSALAYYWDHREAMDAGIEADLAEVDRLRSELGETALAERVRSVPETR